ncbi:MAG TPA: superoxide dismutase family protein [Dehalococcoidia bacterium]|nr:superoxide dismutase family protein [Dehalococcoidia bacterium]
MSVRARVTLTGVAAVVLMLATAGGLGITGKWRATHVAAQGGTTVVLHKLAGDEVGTVTFTQSADKVLVQVSVSGLPPGFHGFHVHTVPLCDAGTGFMSAGGHFNPSDRRHADHAGDMTNLYVGGDGTGGMSLWTDRFTVGQVLGMGGASVIIHASPDNFANIPTRYAPAPDETTLTNGDSGDRIVCGLFQ